MRDKIVTNRFQPVLSRINIHYTSFIHIFVIFTYILCHIFVTSKRPNVTNDIFIYVFTDLL